MKTIFMDFETYYTQTYSLRLMTPAEYILDSRFEMIAVAVAEGDDDPIFMEHDALVTYLGKQDPDNTATVTHNALFDACVLSWRYNFVPKLSIDSMGMARAMILHKTGRVSLDACQKYFGLGAKGDLILKVIGMNKQMIKDADLWLNYAAYGIDDCIKMRGIFKKMIPDFPMSELLVLDGVIRCATQPKFILNTEKLHQHLGQVLADKAHLLARTGLQDQSSLMSDELFARAITSCGVVPPRKMSAKTGLEKYAFAKTDEAFTDLLDHDNPDVQALVAARLGFKTTLEESRTKRFINISRLIWPFAYKSAGWPSSFMPIPLRYSGAHTHRLSGDWKLNLQNLPSRGDNRSLREALVAPTGHVVVAADASQIEARLTAWFCGQEDLRQAFEDGDDIYSIFASEEIYKRPITDKKSPERFIGKQAILGAGFGAGGTKFKWMVETLSRIMLPTPIEYDEIEAKRVINAYRRRYNHISGMWPFLLQLCPQIARGDTGEIGTGGIVSFGQDHIRLPNGLSLFYDNLRFGSSKFGDSWQFTYAGKTKTLHGGKILENIIQALARIIVMDAAVRMRQKFGLHYSLQVHDELVYVVLEKNADEVLRNLIVEMTTRPWWATGVPLAAEGAIGHSYGDVK